MYMEGWKKHRINKGFTLIELLITIAIIGILATVMSYAWTSVLAREHDNIRKADLNRIKTALEQYATDNRTYPALSTVTIPGGTCINFIASNQLAPLTPSYMSSIPSDPTNGNSSSSLTGQYLYITRTNSNGFDSSGYALLATLENNSDPSIVASPFNSPVQVPNYDYNTTYSNCDINSNYVIYGGKTR